ncbi:hypothetical protein DCS_01641 [Drechmeria coniospora]|uniref:Uncharacterized protein n=1 Tax=Drechmeria coniospora TaxID=98403 RepID=A0A151GTQ4_DRECN|nr:hypothetical protein DCS_01641 [Drechmeria coniospora]KYK60504.1 hypothetical protein DCS_01641 [Drechmeria coniospora]
MMHTYHNMENWLTVDNPTVDAVLASTMLDCEASSDMWCGSYARGLYTAQGPYPEPALQLVPEEDLVLEIRRGRHDGEVDSLIISRRSVPADWNIMGYDSQHRCYVFRAAPPQAVARLSHRLLSSPAHRLRPRSTRR